MTAVSENYENDGVNEIDDGVRHAGPAETGPLRHEADRNDFCLVVWRAPPPPIKFDFGPLPYPLPPGTMCLLQ